MTKIAEFLDKAKADRSALDQEEISTSGRRYAPFEDSNDLEQTEDETREGNVQQRRVTAGRVRVMTET